MVAVRTLRQPDVRLLWTPAALDEALNAAYDRVLASGGDTLTAGQWDTIFIINDIRRLLDAGDLAFAAEAYDKLLAV